MRPDEPGIARRDPRAGDRERTAAKRRKTTRPRRPQRRRRSRRRRKEPRRQGGSARRRPTRRPRRDAAGGGGGPPAGQKAGRHGVRRSPAQPKARRPKARPPRRPRRRPSPAQARPRPPAASTAVEVDLPAHIFDAKVNVPLIHQVVVAQQAAARQGTHATKTRGDVRGGGKKPYRQKGTGRARQGSIRAPQFTGGGVVHGPVSALARAEDAEEDEGRGASRRPVRPGQARAGPGGRRTRRRRRAQDRRRDLGAERGHRIAGRARRRSWSSRTARTRSPGRACATPGACT